MFIEIWILRGSCKRPQVFMIPWKYFGSLARDPKYSWFHEHSKNRIHFLSTCNSVWPQNATITHCRPTHGTMRKRHRKLTVRATPNRQKSKTLILSTNVDQKSLKTKFLIAICRLIGDIRQSKTLFIAIFDSRSSIVKSVFDCRISGVSQMIWKGNWSIETISLFPS